MSKKTATVLHLLRLVQGWIFLWAFGDKLFGWGYATKQDQSWLAGNSPTAGFLTHAPNAIVHGLAGFTVVDWLFMLGLLGLGLALITGIGLRIAAVAGPLLMLIMWLALLPLVNNPMIDEHVIYALLFLLWPQLTPAPQWWLRSVFCKKLSWLN